MAIAQANTRGVAPATMNLVAIPEIATAPAGGLSVTDDVHFGINLDEVVHAPLYVDLDRAVALELDLVGLGPRSIDIKRRGGRTAEDDWFIDQAIGRARPQTDMNTARFDAFNQRLPLLKPNYPAGAQISGVPVGGQPKPHVAGATTKAGADQLQLGTRWSKTALEASLARGGGRIHFHLTGMGDLAGTLGKTGGYSHNVTSRELRYVKRFWNRFQHRVTFYNGYSAALLPVIVVPPWIPAWQPDTLQCAACNKAFSRAFPIRYPHHCRLCGRCVCDDCSPDRARLAFAVRRPGSLRETGAVRVCRPCWAAFNRAAPSHF